MEQIGHSLLVTNIGWFIFVSLWMLFMILGMLLTYESDVRADRIRILTSRDAILEAARTVAPKTLPLTDVPAR